MHIPLTDTNSGELLQLLESRPHTVSLSGHTHDIEHKFVGVDEESTLPEKHHHVISGAICGIHWLGQADEYGIPHGMTHCGSPNGYDLPPWVKPTSNLRSWYLPLTACGA